MSKWQCPYCGVESNIEPAGRRRQAISRHLLNNHAADLNSIGTPRAAFPTDGSAE